MTKPAIDPNLDLVLERVVDVRPELVWRAWTEPEQVKRWFAPAPWTTVACEIDLQPGRIFSTTMRSPDGDEFPNSGCYLQIHENRKLMWTDALHAGYRPSGNPFMTATVLLAPEGSGTRYTAIATHADIEARQRHEKMGFHEGWATALEQLVVVAREL
jgi:uncharacterized protein YndB with AHSA1/START domain